MSFELSSSTGAAARPRSNATRVKLTPLLRRALRGKELSSLRGVPAVKVHLPGFKSPKKLPVFESDKFTSRNFAKVRDALHRAQAAVVVHKDKTVEVLMVQDQERGTDTRRSTSFETATGHKSALNAHGTKVYLLIDDRLASIRSKDTGMARGTAPEVNVVGGKETLLNVVSEAKSKPKPKGENLERSSEEVAARRVARAGMEAHAMRAGLGLVPGSSSSGSDSGRGKDKTGSRPVREPVGAPMPVPPQVKKEEVVTDSAGVEMPKPPMEKSRETGQSTAEDKATSHLEQALKDAKASKANAEVRLEAMRHEAGVDSNQALLDSINATLAEIKGEWKALNESGNTDGKDAVIAKDKAAVGQKALILRLLGNIDEANERIAAGGDFFSSVTQAELERSLMTQGQVEGTASVDKIETVDVESVVEVDDGPAVMEDRSELLELLDQLNWAKVDFDDLSDEVAFKMADLEDVLSGMHYTNKKLNAIRVALGLDAKEFSPEGEMLGLEEIVIGQEEDDEGVVVSPKELRRILIANRPTVPVPDDFLDDVFNAAMKDDLKLLEERGINGSDPSQKKRALSVLEGSVHRTLESRPFSPDMSFNSSKLYSLYEGHRMSELTLLNTPVQFSALVHAMPKSCENVARMKAFVEAQEAKLAAVDDNSEGAVESVIAEAKGTNGQVEEQQEEIDTAVVVEKKPAVEQSEGIDTGVAQAQLQDPEVVISTELDDDISETVTPEGPEAVAGVNEDSVQTQVATKVFGSYLQWSATSGVIGAAWGAIARGFGFDSGAGQTTSGYLDVYKHSDKVVVINFPPKSQASSSSHLVISKAEVDSIMGSATKPSKTIAENFRQLILDKVKGTYVEGETGLGAKPVNSGLFGVSSSYLFDAVLNDSSLTKGGKRVAPEDIETRLGMALNASLGYAFNPTTDPYMMSCSRAYARSNTYTQSGVGPKM